MRNTSLRVRAARGNPARSCRREKHSNNYQDLNLSNSISKALKPSLSNDRAHVLVNQSLLGCVLSTCGTPALVLAPKSPSPTRNLTRRINCKFDSNESLTKRERPPSPLVGANERKGPFWLEQGTSSTTKNGLISTGSLQRIRTSAKNGRSTGSDTSTRKRALVASESAKESKPSMTYPDPVTEPHDKENRKSRSECWSAGAAKCEGKGGQRKHTGKNSCRRMTLRCWKKKKGSWSSGKHQNSNHHREHKLIKSRSARTMSMDAGEGCDNEEPQRNENSYQCKHRRSLNGSEGVKQVRDRFMASTPVPPNKILKLGLEEIASKQTGVDPVEPQTVLLSPVACKPSTPTTETKQGNQEEQVSPVMTEREKENQEVVLSARSDLATKRSDSVRERSPARSLSRSSACNLQRCSSLPESRLSSSWANSPSAGRLSRYYDCEEERKKAQERVDSWKRKKRLEEALEQECELRRYSSIRQKRAQSRANKDRKRHEIYAVNEIFQRCDRVRLKILHESNKGGEQAVAINAV